MQSVLKKLGYMKKENLLLINEFNVPEAKMNDLKVKKALNV